MPESPKPQKAPEMRERVAHAIARENGLQQDKENWEREIQRLEQEIAAAKSANDEALLMRLRSQQADYKDMRTATIAALNEALEDVASIKAQLQKELESYQELIARKRFFPRY